MQFSFSRFLLLLRKEFSEQGRLYLLGLGALGGFWFVLLGLVTFQGGGDLDTRHILLGLGIVVGGTVFAQYQFNALSRPSQTIRFLHLPASTLEKTMSAFFWCFVVFLPAALALFYALDTSMISLMRTRLAHDPSRLAHYEYLPIWHLKIHVFLFTLAASIGVLGRAYFRQYAFVKTALAVFAVFVSVEMLFQFLVKSWVRLPAGGQVLGGELFEKVTFRLSEDSSTDYVELPLFWQMLFAGIFMVGLPILCWFLTWLRLRETEV